MQERWKHARCLVTGASSGIGRALGTALVKAGASVLGTGRDDARLQAWRGDVLRDGIPSERAQTFPADLTDAQQRERLLGRASEQFGGALDVVVHAAGVGAYGRFMSHDPTVLRRIVEVNFFTCAELARGVYPMLCRGRRSALVVIGSIVARRGLPGRSEYSASKFAVAGFVEAIRSEWLLAGIHVLLVNPGFVRSEFERHLLVDTSFHKVEHERVMPAEQVATRTLRALARGKNEVTIAKLGPRLLLLANRWMPRLVDFGLGRWTRKLYARHGVDPARDAASRADHDLSDARERF